MAVVVSHAMRRYPASPPSSSYSSHCLGGEGSFPPTWSREDVGESSLSRSMRYADPWLYGSVRGPPGFVLAPALVLCSCTEYLTGTKRSSKKGPAVCKKCKGTRLPLSGAETLRASTKFGTVRCYPTSSILPPSSPPMRSGTVRVTSHSRPSILPTGDPYEVMRRSRLSSENGSQFKPSRATSPSKINRNETKNFNASLANRPPSVSSAESPTSPGRRSILECDINPYELMSSDSLLDKDASITFVNGQRIRVRAPSSEQEYEEVQVAQAPRQPSQIPKLKNVANKSKKSPPPKPNEKESDSNRFKSILKKPTTFSDTDSSGGLERSPSPALKSGTHFYLPLPVNTPRKKVQFLVENELVALRQKDRKDVSKSDSDAVLRDDLQLQETNVYEEVPQYEEEPLVQVEEPQSDLDRKICKLRRSVSERFIQEPIKVVFHDTMALRTRTSRSDARGAFAEVTDLERLDGLAPRSRSNSPTKPIQDNAILQLEESDDATPENVFDLEPEDEQYVSFKIAIETTTELEEITTELVTDVLECKGVLHQQEELSNSDEVFISSGTQLEGTISEEIQNINTNSPPSVPPRKRSSSKQPPATITLVSSPTTPTTNLVKVESPNSDYYNKTVVQIRPTDTVHKLQIKNEFLENPCIPNLLRVDNPQRKTSIMINGDDCYSTINVNDDVPLYQSSVVVKDVESDYKGCNNGRSSSVYITGNFSSPTSNLVTFESFSNKKFIEISNFSNQSAVTLIQNSPECPDSLIQIHNTPIDEICHSSDVTDQAKTSNAKLYNGVVMHDTKKTTDTNFKDANGCGPPGKNNSKTHIEDDLKHLLKDPVEAVKRNLVPHVCGKSDVLRRPRKHAKKAPSIPEAELLENPFFESVAEGLESHTLTKLIQESLFKLKTFDSLPDDLCSEHSSSTQYEMMDAGSDCYTDNSNRSSVTEDELGARAKFYELLADSAIAEIAENEDHQYETIKFSSDPIYEEICPPPLPSNPPPSSIIDDLQLDKQFTTRSIFEGASKYDILSYLVDAKERGIIPEDSYHLGNSEVVVEEEDSKSVSEPYNRVSHMSTVSDSSEDNSLILHPLIIDGNTNQKSAEVERNDSGLGSETSKSSLSRFRTKLEPSMNCEDCENVLESPTENEPLICRKCAKKRSERKEIITEIVETEEKYSRDLQIILEEFYQPMLVAGLLTPDQLAAIFLNVEELLDNSQALAERLRDAVEIAIEQGDEDLLTVNIGKLFLEAAPMLHAFESYCIRQGPASLLLASLEKEKELLRIFLRVSQMENTMLRRMNLNSFLMVPVQRVTKYPLLLARLHKSTSTNHEARERIKDAQHKIELHLSHMNSETRDVPSKLWRRIGSSSGRRSSSEMDLVSIKLRKIAVDVLEWNHDEAKFALEGKLLFTQPTDNNWRKGRTIKLAPINALLVTNGKPSATNRSERPEEDGLTFPRNSGVREAALLLVRDKNGRYSLLREPLYLDRCIVATDPAWHSYFEVQEVIGKDTFIFKAEDDELTRTWYRQMQYHAQGLGGWRKRRNALANIMINGMGMRS